jgi:hypothetical protein
MASIPLLVVLLVPLLATCVPGGARSDGVPTAAAPFTLTALDVGQTTFMFRGMPLSGSNVASSLQRGPCAAPSTPHAGRCSCICLLGVLVNESHVALFRLVRVVTTREFDRRILSDVAAGGHASSASRG